MTMTPFRTMSFLLLPLMLSVMACGGAQSTTTPSSLGTGATTISSDRHGSPSPSNPTNNTTEVHGIVRSLAGACPTLRLSVESQIVTTTASTEFSHGGCAAVRVGSSVEVKGAAQADGSVAASRLEIRGEPDENDDNEENEVEGVIVNKAGVCPSLTFTIGRTSVRTNAATSFHDVSCAALVNGMAVEVKGQRQSDGTLLASRVEGHDD